MRAVVLVVLMLSTSVAEAAIYRCSDKDRTVFQDKPCAGSNSGANQVTIDPRFLRTGEGGGGDGAACVRPSSQQIADAQEDGTVLACMSQPEVLEAARPGKEYNARTGSDERGAYEVWFFSNTQASFPPRVTFRNGFVESFGVDDSYGMPKTAASPPQ